MNYSKRCISFFYRLYLLLIATVYALFKRVRIRGDLRNVHIGSNCQFESSVSFIVNNGSIIVGDNCVFKTGCILNTYGGNICIGKNCTFNPYCVIYGDGNLDIGDDVRIATHTVIVPANHTFKDKSILIREQGEVKLGISIGNDVWIGAGVRILDGVKIGNGSVIGAGSVVTKSTTPYSINVGVPSHTLGYRK